MSSFTERRPKFRHPQDIPIPQIDSQHLRNAIENNEPEIIVEIVHQYCLMLKNEFGVEITDKDLNFLNSITLTQSFGELMNLLQGRMYMELDPVASPNKIIILIKNIGSKENPNLIRIPIFYLAQQPVPSPEIELKRLSFILAKYAMDFNPYHFTKSESNFTDASKIITLALLSILYPTISAIIANSHESEVYYYAKLLTTLFAFMYLWLTTVRNRTEYYRWLLNERITTEGNTPPRDEFE